jgi:hypothetical protein
VKINRDVLSIHKSSPCSTSVWFRDLEFRARTIPSGRGLLLRNDSHAHSSSRLPTRTLTSSRSARARQPLCHRITSAVWPAVARHSRCEGTAQAVKQRSGTRVRLGPARHVWPGARRGPNAPTALLPSRSPDGTCSPSGGAHGVIPGGLRARPRRLRRRASIPDGPQP